MYRERNQKDDVQSLVTNSSQYITYWQNLTRAHANI